MDNQSVKIIEKAFKKSRAIAILFLLLSILAFCSLIASFFTWPSCGYEDRGGGIWFAGLIKTFLAILVAVVLITVSALSNGFQRSNFKRFPQKIRESNKAAKTYHTLLHTVFYINIINGILLLMSIVVNLVKVLG